MKRRICAGLTAVLICAACPALAGGFRADYDSGTEVIQWSVRAEAGGYVNLTVLSSALELDAVTAPELTGCESILLKTAVIGTDGIASGSMGLPEQFQDGRYYIRALWQEGEACRIFVKAETSALSQLAARINRAEDGQVMALLKEQDGLFEDDGKFFAQYGTEIAVYVAGQSPAGGYDAAALLSARMLGEGLARFQDSGLALADFIMLYGGYMPDSVLEQYDTATAPIREKTEKLLRRQMLVEKPFAEIFAGCVRLAGVLACTQAAELQILVLDQHEALEIDLRPYRALKNDYYRSQVFQSLLGQLDRINTTAELRVAFDRCTAEQAAKAEQNENQNQNTGRPASGSGGNRGGSSGGLSGGERPAPTETPAPTKTPEAEPEMTDIQGHWAETEIRQMVEAGIAAGYKDATFRPDNTVTRAEFVKLVCGLLNLDLSGAGETGFQDVTEADWFYPCVSAAVRDGLVRGISDTEFGPELSISREDAAVILDRMAGGALESADGTVFLDIGETADYARPAVERLGAAGLLRGEAGYFLPKRSITRAEAVCLLWRLKSAKEKGGQT